MHFDNTRDIRNRYGNLNQFCNNSFFFQLYETYFPVEWINPFTAIASYLHNVENEPGVMNPRGYIASLRLR